VDAVVWDVNHAELDMQFGKRFRKIKSISFPISLVSKFLI
jgi:hypothetical protein